MGGTACSILASGESWAERNGKGGWRDKGTHSRGRRQDRAAQAEFGKGRLNKGGGTQESPAER